MSSQLQVTGEAKIRDIQGPVVANSGVITALDGAANQYVRGDGTLADFPTTTGGGSSVSYYLNGSVNQGTIGGVAYKELSKDPILGVGTDFTISANGYVASFITDANDPDSIIIPGGNWNTEIYFSVDSNSNSPYFYVEVYKYDGSTFTLLGSNQTTPEYITAGTTITPYYGAVAIPITNTAITDRIAIRIYVVPDGRTVTLHTENSHLGQIVTTFSKGMVSLNNLTDQSQYLTTGTSGTDFAIVSTGDTHTFNLPITSATNTGKLSSTDWTTFNNKQNAITLTTTGTSGAATLVGSTLNIPNYTTDLSGYLPLTGGTLTGALNGTSASFSGNITSNLSLLINRFSNGDYLALKIENRPITNGNNGSGFIAFYSNSGDATSDTYTTGKIYGKFDTNSYNSARLTLATVTGNEIYQDVLTAKDTNVGIGTINPSQTLHLFTTSATANGVGTAIQIQSAGTGANQAWVGVNKGTGNGLTFSVENNSIIFNTGASTPFGGTERFRINTTDAVFTNPLSVITNDNNFAFNVQLRNNNTGTQALTGLGISDSSNTRKGQVLWIPSNYVTASLRNSFLVSSVTNVPLILCADATGADTPNIIFQSGATDKMVMIGSSGNFGIGTSSPKERFEIAGLTANIRLYGRSGVTQNQLSSNLYYDGTTWVRDNNSFGAVAIQLDSTSGNLIFNTTATTSGFPAERLRINSSGNVGIGTTSPASLLSVGDSGYSGRAISASVNSAAYAVTFRQDSASGLGLQLFTSQSAWGGNAFTIDTSSSTLFRILSNGNVGIGTSSPGVKFVNSGAAVSDNPTLGSATIGASAMLSANGLYGLYSGVSINGHVWHQVQRNDGNSSVYNYILQPLGGNVGIGTISPSARLEVDGNPLSASFNSSTGVYTRYKYNGTNVGIIGTANQIIGGGSTTAFALGTESNDYMLFVTNNAERARITSGGNVLIGTTTDNGSKFQVTGAATFSSSVTATTGLTVGSLSSGSDAIITLATNASGAPRTIYYKASNATLNFTGTGGTDLMTISNGGVITIANLGTGTVTATSGVLSVVSDMNLKIEDGFVENALEKVMNLKPRYFLWKEESNLPTDIRQLGFFAQEVNEALGEEAANTPKNENENWGIYDRGMIAFLTAAIQEQQAQIEELKELIKNK